MRFHETFLDVVGNTPLVRLRSVARGVKPTILAKLEMLNPGGSVKDRIGLRMIEAAEAAGLLKPGGTIVEPTSGNTGHGLAIAAAIRGYKCIFVMPDKMSQEKVSLLRAYGAEVVITPTAVPPESPESYYRVADRLAEEIPGGFQPNQYFNSENPKAHYETTGPEIWDQTDGQIDVLVVGVGTGGTISGAGRFLKEKNPDIQVVGADPEGSVFSGDQPRPYLVEGIGEDFWPETFDPSVVDRYIRVSDRDSFLTARAITRQEGILVGGSSGTALFAALVVARELRDDAVVVVIFPDTGRNYLSKLYSDSWLLQYGFLARPEIIRVEEVLASRRGPVPMLVRIGAHDKVRQAVDRLQEFGISQAPVVREDSNDVTAFVGAIQERNLLDRIFRDPDSLQADVAEVMGPPLPLVEFSDPLEVAFAEFQQAPAVIVAKGGEALGILTRADLLEFLAHRERSRT
ncbi:MAG: cystathionine beta-synthase [Actinomycetota bacterium]|nr:cystathionine beta-synthase [Actinomycetota bacterium]